ncbi:hypothetical protein I7I53_09136 [Histoplasma capsulatum var. duboisii H88]|uniref:Uncharacterized protein n=1 Tax=Ajellomyces capsulatus (strain H88) TaxID=544711 RepID=A0A8A1L4Q6_AJEC8|nr:hypothetical protein I7I53_09136 [Histoplasma capsulatum var. duboisii H88]
MLPSTTAVYISTRASSLREPPIPKRSYSTPWVLRLDTVSKCETQTPANQKASRNWFTFATCPLSKLNLSRTLQRTQLSTMNSRVITVKTMCSSFWTI